MSALATHARRLLAYHGWAYARLLDELANLSEEQYLAPCGLFFGNIDGTLNHLAAVDRIWLARVRGEPSPFDHLDAWVSSDRAELRRYLEVGVTAWHQRLDDVGDDALLTPLTYHNMAGEPQQRPLLDIVSHLVNHGTHHRGQITTVLTALGHPAPKLDYIYALAELP